MFGNWKLAANSGPLGRLRWLMEGSRHGYLGVALSARRSAMGLHCKLFRKGYISQKTNYCLAWIQFLPVHLHPSYLPHSWLWISTVLSPFNWQLWMRTKEPERATITVLGVIGCCCRFVLYVVLAGLWLFAKLSKHCRKFVNFNFYCQSDRKTWPIWERYQWPKGAGVGCLLLAASIFHCWAVEIMTVLAMGFNGCSFPMAANFRIVVNLLLNLLDPKGIIFRVLGTCFAINDDLFVGLISIHRIAGTQDSLQLSYDSDKSPNWP